MTHLFIFLSRNYKCDCCDSVNDIEKNHVCRAKEAPDTSTLLDTFALKVYSDLLYTSLSSNASSNTTELMDQKFFSGHAKASALSISHVMIGLVGKTVLL